MLVYQFQIVPYFLLFTLSSICILLANNFLRQWKYTKGSLAFKNEWLQCTKENY